MKASPIPTEERIHIIDVLRGLALLGILLVNMAYFKSAAFHTEGWLPTDRLPHTPLNQGTRLAIDLFAVGKFYPMFSFLFGLGFHLFFERLQQKMLDPNPYFKRRLYFLLFIGLIHLLFIWSGDILHTYALAGFLLLFFYSRQSITIFIWGILLIVFSAIIQASITFLNNAFIHSSANTIFADQASVVETAKQVYSQGSYLDILTFRMNEEVFIILFSTPFSIINVLGLFLIGLYMGRKKWFVDIKHKQKHWKRLFVTTTLTGGPLSLLYVALQYGFSPIPVWMSTAIATGLNVIAGPLLMLSYVSFFVLLFQRSFWNTFFTPFSYVGRMALTNYLLQSILCVLIFYGFGLGLFGTIDVATGVFITFVIYGAQIIVSYYWLLTFERGPMEMVWRKWMYSQ